MSSADNVSDERKSFWCAWLINDRVTLKTQLISSFLLMTVISGGITLAICLGMLYGSASTTYDNADNIIIGNTKSNSENMGNEIASAVEQQLKIIAESVCMVSSLYASNLLTYSYVSSTRGTMFSPVSSFREYNFVQGCNYPNCPKDFGPIYTRSRIPYLPAFQYGSIEHSSVYLYSSTAQHSLRNDSAWNTTFATHSEVKQVYDGLAYQDNDLNIMYNQGPNTTVMFYLSAQVFAANSSSSSVPYYAVHRTFPGIYKNDSAYDPSRRTWFTKAPVNGFYLYGPYKETFTKQLVVTLSSKINTIITNAQGGRNAVTVVASGVVLLQSLSTIVNSVHYDYNGYGVLITRNSQQVLVWGTRNDVYNADTQAFKTVIDFDQNLAQYDLSKNTVFEYVDPQGVGWIVTVNVFLNTANAGSNEGLSLLVFSQRSLVDIPLNSLSDHIDTTTNSISTETIIIVCVTLGAVMMVVIGLVLYITYPLEIMQSICSEVVKISAEDEDHRDYTEVVQKAYVNLSRTDEVGLLALDYYHILCMLQNKTIEKKNTPKYPMNPLYLQDVVKDYTSITWEQFMVGIQSLAIQKEDVNVTLNSNDHHQTEHINNKKVGIAEEEDTGLDVLASFTKQVEKIKPANNSVVELVRKDSSSSSSSHQIVPVKEDGDVLGGQPSLQQQQPGNNKDLYRYVHANTKSDRASVSSTYYEITPTQPVGYFTSLKSQLYMLSGVLLVGLVITMLITVIQLNTEGSSWTDDSKVTLTSSQMQNIQEIAYTKAKFVRTYFAQLSMELLGATAYSSSTLQQSFIRSNYIPKHLYLPSFSTDTYNPYAAHVIAGTSANYSGYFVSSDAQCSGTGTCTITHNSNQTRLTSLLDIKYDSYLYSGNQLSFLQIALNSNGYTRYFPYIASSTNSNPSTCLIGVTDTSLCANLYTNSRCSSTSYASYPVYEARCRSWYSIGHQLAQQNDVQQVYFQYPRLSSNGQYVLTAILPIYTNQSSINTFQGVISSNILASKLSDSINSLKVLSSGYCYLIDAKNTSNVILHPNVKSAACSQVKCAEGFSNSEYSTFANQVLDPIQSSDGQVLPTNIIYDKKGKSWRVVTSLVSYEAVKYVLLVTVPEDEVLQASNDTQDSINTTVRNMIIVFVFVIAIFAVLLISITRWLIYTIVHPVDDLRLIFDHAKNEDYSIAIPSTATSFDMKVLLDALSKLMIALRFGSDSYARGNITRARNVFTDALHLYTAIHHIKGIGVSLNNLAAVELADKHYHEAEQLYLQAIENAQSILTKATNAIQAANAVAAVVVTTEANDSNNVEAGMKSKDVKLVAYEADRSKYTRVLSDRYGNLAILYLEQALYPQAFAILEEYLAKDKKLGYIKGCIVKQGILGQYYMKQHEYKSAERILQSALEFIQSKDDDTLTQYFTSKDWIVEDGEIPAMKQMALYHMAVLYADQINNEVNTVSFLKEKKVHLVLRYSLQALGNVSHVQIVTIRKIVALIKQMFESYPQAFGSEQVSIKYLEQLQHLLEEHEELFGGGNEQDNKQKNNKDGSGDPKRVVFAVDYSGSMSGTKIRSARENLSSIITNHIHTHDSVALLRFNSDVDIVLHLVKKVDTTDAIIKEKIDSFASPNNSTRLYDAIAKAYTMLSSSTKASNQSEWIIVLTDGEDNGSSCSLSSLIQILSTQQKVDIIVVGIGSDVQTDILTQIAQSTKQGQYVFAEGDKSSIDEAFQQVAQIIQGNNVMLEDY